MEFEYKIKNNEVTITNHKGTSKDVIIPNTIENVSVTTIGEYAFYGNKLTSIVLPKTLATINSWAFGGIGDYAFGNNELTSIVLPETLTTIGECAFWNNELTSIVLPDKFRTDEQVQSIFKFSLEELENRNRKFITPYMSKLLFEYVSYHFHEIITQYTTPSMEIVKEAMNQ